MDPVVLEKKLTEYIRWKRKTNFQLRKSLKIDISLTHLYPMRKVILQTKNIVNHKTTLLEHLQMVSCNKESFFKAIPPSRRGLSLHKRFAKYDPNSRGLRLFKHRHFPINITNHKNDETMRTFPTYSSIPSFVSSTFPSLQFFAITYTTPSS
jgi:hypothetical protein